MSNSNHLAWNQDDIANWLGSLSLYHLVPNFERLQVDGSKLVTLTDTDLRNKLKIVKPAEIMAVRGAINTLIDESMKANPSGRKVSSALRPGPEPWRDRAGSYERGSYERGSKPDDGRMASKTIPRDHRNTIATDRGVMRQPKLVQGSASELVDKECKYSGWIRKQGGGYKSWKRRYLILRMGCLYYFPNETASSAKGSFVLSGYQTEICSEPEIVKKYKYTLKLIPMNPQVRTYYISVGSERELTGWKKAIDEEIRAVSRRISHDRISYDGRQNSSDIMTMPSSLPLGHNFDDDDDDDDDADNPYDIPEGVDFDDDDHNYDDPESVIYDKPEGENFDDDDDEDDPYSKIDEGFAGSLVGAGRGDGSKPTVPSRSAFSLQPASVSKLTPPSASPMLHVEPEGEEDVAYLPIIGTGPALDPILAQPDLSRTASPPPNNGNITTAIRRHDSDYEDDAPEDSGGDGDDDDGGYYIMFRKPEELMPASCVFDRLERAEADRLLKEKNRDGTYLIRAGSHAGAEKVLSVWHIDRCRHYKLFKDENSSYSLTQGQAFRTIPELLQYYTLQSHLPRSDFYLGDPFNPSDH